MKNSVKCILVIFLLAFISCNEDKEKHIHGPNDTAPDSVIIRYGLSYNENTDSTIITASFQEILERQVEKEGQTACYVLPLAKLKEGSAIAFNDIALECNEHKNYGKKVKGYIAGGTFRLTDRKGRNLLMKVPAPVKIAFPSLRVLNKNFEISFPYEGTLLKNGEEIRFSFVDEFNHSQFIISSIEGNLVKAPVNETYADGPAILRMERSSSSVSRNKDRIKFMERVSYTAKDLPIEIISQPGQTDPPRIRKGNNPQ
jgi:hypothetical protein